MTDFFSGFLKCKLDWFQGTLFVGLSDICDIFVTPEAATQRYSNNKLLEKKVLQNFREKTCEAFLFYSKKESCNGAC